MPRRKLIRKKHSVKKHRRIKHVTFLFFSLLIIFILVSVGLFFSHTLRSFADYALDSSYGSGRKVITSFGNNAWLLDVALQSDGKAVAVGYNSNGGHFNWGIGRYNTDGSLDTGFGTNGIVTQDFGIDNKALAVAIQPTDGKIVVGGADKASNSAGHGWTVARYNRTNGSLDTSFGINGIVTTPIFDGQLNDLALQQDGKIVTVGYDDAATGSTGNRFIVVRYNPDGTLDSSFGSGGIVSTQYDGSTFDRGHAVALQSDGKIVVFGDLSYGGSNSLFTARLNTNGSLDTTFGTNGFVAEPIFGNSDSGYDFTLQSDGKIVVTGFFQTSSGGTGTYVIRYNSDGSRDSSFGSGGIVSNPFATGNDFGLTLAIQPTDGKIVVGGINPDPSNSSKTDFVVRRFSTDGSLDTTFGTNGSVITSMGVENSSIRSVAIQSDGKILAVGQASNGIYSDWALARYANTPTNIDQCKNGGWQNFFAPSFKNQGDCVSFVATHGKNPPNGSN